MVNTDGQFVILGMVTNPVVGIIKPLRLVLYDGMDDHYPGNEFWPLHIYKQTTEQQETLSCKLDPEKNITWTAHVVGF